jgi:hypothetical protein
MVIEQDCKVVGKHEYRWELCDQCVWTDFYKVYIKRTFWFFTWWERINDVELTTIDEVEQFIKTHKND